MTEKTMGILQQELTAIVDLRKELGKYLGEALENLQEAGKLSVELSTKICRLEIIVEKIQQEK